MNGWIASFMFDPMATLPLWVIFVGTVLVILVSVEIGFRLGSCRRRHMKEVNKDEPIGEIVAAILALLAFMLGFTFDMAATRYEDRRVLVLEEANAMDTTYLRAGMLPEPQRSDIRKLLREDVAIHTSAVQTGEVMEGVAGVERLNNQLWTQAEIAMAKNQGSIAAGLFTFSLNNMIDLFTKRVTLGLRTHIANTIWISLYFISICAMGILGFHGGMANTRRLAMVVPLVLAFSVVILLIAGLDRPMAGLIKVSQQPLIELKKTWDAEDTASRIPPTR